MTYTYKTTRETPEGEIEYEIEFSVTSWGSSPSWSDPGDPEEIDLESVTSCQVGDPDTELTFGSKPPAIPWSEFPDELYENLMLEVLEKFDFADALQAQAEDYADYERDRRMD